MDILKVILKKNEEIRIKQPNKPNLQSLRFAGPDIPCGGSL